METILGHKIVKVQCRHLIPTLNAWAARACNTLLHARLRSCIPVMNAWMTSQLNVTLMNKLRGSSMCYANSFGMLPMLFVQPGIG